MTFRRGDRVRVAHGPGFWTGTVAYVQPGYITVAYPDRAMELVDLSRHIVTVIRDYEVINKEIRG